MASYDLDKKSLTSELRGFEQSVVNWSKLQEWAQRIWAKRENINFTTENSIHMPIYEHHPQYNGLHYDFTYIIIQIIINVVLIIFFMFNINTLYYEYYKK